MPITYSPIAAGKKWTGSMWSVSDEGKLAHIIAQVALGQSRQVEKILRETNFTNRTVTPTAFAGARKKLSVLPGEKTYHRDGWVFQVISWIAAHQQQPNDLIRPPQMVHAQKGFDGVIIRINEKEETIAWVIICEEKASKKPRGKITSQVWPEFIAIESGMRDNELVASVTSILERYSYENADDITANILWKKQRAYRVAVTTLEEKSDDKSLQKLFKGYEKKIKGDAARRTAEVLCLNDVREWLNSISHKALAELDEMEQYDV